MRAWWLRNRLIQVAHVTSLGCLCPKPASFETFGCIYITAFTSISSLPLEIEVILFAVNRIPKENLKNTRGNLKARNKDILFS